LGLSNLKRKQVDRCHRLKLYFKLRLEAILATEEAPASKLTIATSSGT